MEAAFDGGKVTATDVADAVCSVWGLGRAFKVLAFTNPVTAVIAEIVDVGCAVYGVSRVFGAI